MSTLTFSNQSVVIGIDVHKYAHVAVALDVFGRELSHYEFSNQTLDEFKQWLLSLSSSANLIIGLEDIHGYGLRINNYLATQGFAVCYVPPILTAGQRHMSVHHEKTDKEDARRVGKVILRQSEETLPATAIISTKAKTIRAIKVLLQEYRQRVSQQTATKNQLHVLLHEYYGDTYKQDFKDIFNHSALEWYKADLASQQKEDYLAEDILRRFEWLALCRQQLKSIQKRIGQLSQMVPEVKSLEYISGCGPNTAAIIIAEIGEISRFSKESKLARYAGIAPVKQESGKSSHLHTDQFGNRRLNLAVHRIALTQIGKSGDQAAKVYHKRKQQEKNSKLWSLRCLKRYIVREIYTVLTKGTKPYQKSKVELMDKPISTNHFIGNALLSW